MSPFAKWLSQKTAPFIVAEVGINHNGELKKAFEMIEVAYEANANAVKFQTFKAKEFVSDKNSTYTYKSQGNTITESMLEMFERVEFSEDEWLKIKEYCDKVGIEFLSTPQNYTDLQILLKLEMNAIKIGSDDLINIPLLKKYAKTNLPLILSTGMANMADIHFALEAVNGFKRDDIVVLVCTSQYPTPKEETNLLRIKSLKQAYHNIIIGFSDHTQGSQAAIVAASLGAKFFEKHFTLSHDLAGPDHWFSSNPKELKEWVQSIKDTYTMLGDGIVMPSKNEKEMLNLARRSAVAIKDIEEGDILDEYNTALMRPNGEIQPNMYEKILGLKAAKKIEKNRQLSFGDIKW